MSILSWLNESIIDPTGGMLTGAAKSAGTWISDKISNKVITRDLDPDVKEAALSLVKAWNESYSEDTGGEAYIARGFRTQEEQDQYVAEGRSEVAHSKHQDGLAVDIEFRDAETGHPIVPDDTPPDWFEVLGEMGEDLGFTWGGRWKNFVDMVHFEA